MTLTVGSLFSGIGGLDLGLERAGMRVIWQSEIDPYACRVLAKHWPEVPNHGDIKRINWGDVVRPDVICGGYPCQPFSTAGKRNGTDDPRHLWPWVRDAISELRPRYAVLENVRGHLTLGGTTVIGNLADIGYDAEWRIVSAASVGAPHRRDRLFIVAYRSREASDLAHADGFGCVDDRPSVFPNQAGVSAFAYLRESGSFVADAIGFELDDKHDRGTSAKTFGKASKIEQAARRSGNGSSLGRWLLEPDVGRVADGVPDRVDRLRGLGNAVVPQVAEIIGRLVVAHHERNTCFASTS